MRKKILNGILLAYIALSACFIMLIPVMALDKHRKLQAGVFNVLTVESNALRGEIDVFRFGYTHLYPLRLFLSHGLFLIGLFALLRLVYGKFFRKKFIGYSNWLDTGKKRRFTFVTATMILLVCTFLFEQGLKMARIYYPNPSVYAEGKDGHLYVHQANLHFQNAQPEFMQDVITNSMGIVDREWPLEKQKAIRIAIFGDSYTEGFGAVMDSSYPRLLGGMLPDAEVMNFGVAGSDPVYDYTLLREKALAYHPDICIMAINISDISDIIIRGGFERYQSDGSVRSRSGPWWEPVYASGCIARLYIHFFAPRAAQDHGVSQKRIEEREMTFRKMEQAIDSFEILCTAHHIRPVLMFHPVAGEIKGGWMHCAPAMDYARAKGYKVLDVMKGFNDAGIDSTNMAQYYWPLDGHHNGAGYRRFALVVRDSLFTPGDLLLR